MKTRTLITLTAVLAAWPPGGAAAEVQSLTLGITMNCPYGLGG